MKKSKLIQVNKVLMVLMFCVVFVSCKKDDIAPNDEAAKKEVSELELQNDIGSANLTVDATKVEETDDGYKIEGSIGAEMEDGSSYKIAEGNFEFVVDINGKIIRISGEGTVDFPDIGIFKKIGQNFTWKKIQSHIEYETGKFYKDNYSTDIPLNDTLYYFHFKVFADSDKEGFSLKSAGNSVVYNFTDFYLDINDPAVFFKAQLWKPGSGAKSEATSLAKKLFNKVVAAGKVAKEYAGAPGVVFGISNHGTIKTGTYEFSKPEVFEELFGYNGFEALNAQGYIKLKNVPIPETVVLRMTGDLYYHGALKNGIPWTSDLMSNKEQVFLDWFNNVETGPSSMTFNGSLDFGGKGIGAVFGILNGIDDALGYDVLNSDFNFDLIGAVYQEQSTGPDMDVTSFVRFGGEVRKPILADLFGEKIAKFLPSVPEPTGYLYFNVKDNLDDWSIFVQQSANIIIPKLGKKEYIDSYFLLNKDGLLAHGKFDLPTYGIFTFDSEFTGFIGPEKFELETKYNKDITLPNGINIGHKDLHVKISSDPAEGLYMDGTVNLPLGITGASFLANFSTEKVTMSGSFSSSLNLGYGFNLPTSEMTYSVSTDPTDSLSFSGKIDVPHLGYTSVTGSYLSPVDFSYRGVVNSDLDFAGIQLPIANGSLTLDPSEITLSGSYDLPYGLKSSNMTGTITSDEMFVSGTMSSKIAVGGYNFNFANSYINASTLTGVKLGGEIDLHRFSVKVNGAINPGGTFVLTGVYNYNTKYLKATIHATVRQSGIVLTGTGSIYGLLGNKLAEGNISFTPNWANGTISACINGHCVDL